MDAKVAARFEMMKLLGTLRQGDEQPGWTVLRALKAMADPFTAVLCNEAREPHDEIRLTVCHQIIIRNNMKYRLVEFSRDGACYHWCGYDPTATPTVTA